MVFINSLLFVYVRIYTECICQKYANVFWGLELQMNVFGPVLLLPFCSTPQSQNLAQASQPLTCL